jgi:hypothetical protein
LDGEDALGRYFPSGDWLRQLQGFAPAPEQDWRDLVMIYGYWRDRFPERAYTYAELGMAYQCYLDDPAQAASAVRAGIEKGAVPVGLLEAYAGKLEEGDEALCGGR